MTGQPRPRPIRSLSRGSLTLPRRVGLLCAASIMVGAATVGDPSTAALIGARRDRPPPPGYRQVTVASSGFAIAIPEPWMALELSQPTPPNADARFAGQVADARNVPNARFFATASDPSNHLVVQVYPRLRSLDWGSLQRQLSREHFQYLTPQRTSVAHKPAIVVSITEDNVVRQTFLTFYFVLGTRGVIGFAFVADHDRRHDPVSQAMINSVQLLAQRPSRLPRRPS